MQYYPSEIQPFRGQVGALNDYKKLHPEQKENSSTGTLRWNHLNLAYTNGKAHSNGIIQIAI